METRREFNIKKTLRNILIIYLLFVSGVFLYKKIMNPSEEDPKKVQEQNEYKELEQSFQNL